MATHKYIHRQESAHTEMAMEVKEKAKIWEMFVKKKHQDFVCEGQWGGAKAPSCVVLYWWIVMLFIELGNAGLKSLEGNQFRIIWHIHFERTKWSSEISWK